MHAVVDIWKWWWKGKLGYCDLSLRMSFNLFLDILVSKPQVLNYCCGDYPSDPLPFTELLQTSGLILGLLGPD